jgi:hypothetical protein
VGLAHLRAAGALKLARVIALAGLLAGSPAFAHDSPYSALDLERRPDGLLIAVTLHPVDAAALLGIAAPESLLDADRLRREGPRLASGLNERMSFAADGRRLEPVFRGCSVRGDRRGVVTCLFAPWSRPPGRLRLHARLVPEDPTHETYLQVEEERHVLRQDVLTSSHQDLEVFGRGAAGLAGVVAVFVPMGVHHVYTGPDHLLFVIGLLLLGGRLRRLLEIVTGFTIAHSLTLALAALGIVSVSSRIVEPLIALSIAVVGIENLRASSGSARPAPDRRAPLAFGFGLIHGLGFAGVLRETGLPREALAPSLLSFNAGVEIAQASVVLALVPFLSLARARMPRTAPVIATGGSWLVVAAGAFWLAQRVLAPA